MELWKNTLRITYHLKENEIALMLILDVKTRWSSTHQMLRKLICSVLLLFFHSVLGRALDLKDAIQAYVTHDMSNGGDLALLSTADWAAIQLVSNWLKTFRLATTEMSTTKKPMLSSTRDTFVTLQSDLKNIIKDLPASVDPELLDGLMNAHLKLSQYFAKCDVSPYGLWAHQQNGRSVFGIFIFGARLWRIFVFEVCLWMVFVFEIYLSCLSNFKL
jgi:hypothetical protein